MPQKKIVYRGFGLDLEKQERLENRTNLAKKNIIPRYKGKFKSIYIGNGKKKLCIVNRDGFDDLIALAGGLG